MERPGGRNERPWVRNELPWLRSGPLFRVHAAARAELGGYLGRFPYRILQLDGRAMVSRRDAHGELARVFGFPAYYGRNWDAFHDCFGDFAAAHGHELIAVVWEFADVAARVAPATAIEVGWALIGVRDHHPRLALDVFAFGEGEDFDHP